MTDEIIVWLKNSILGIIILGAIGSLLAIVLGKIISYVCGLFPATYTSHRNRISKQAYFLGFSAACIHHDKTGRLILSALIYHFSLLFIYVSSFLFLSSIFIVAIIVQTKTTLTAGTLITSSGGFLSLYLAYFEFEYIYRTYLTYWKSSLERAEKAYANRDKPVEEAEKPVEN